AWQSLEFLQSLIQIIFPSASIRPFWFDFSFNLNVVVIVVALMLILWLISGVFAAWRVSNKDIATSINNDARGSTSKQSNRVSRFLVSVQVVLSFFLLVLSGSFLAIFQGEASRAYEQENSDRIVSGMISLNPDRYGSSSQQQLYRDRLRQELLRVDEVESVTFAAALAGDGSERIRVALDFDSPSDLESAPINAVNWVEPGFFSSQGFIVSEGRQFNRLDTSESLPVVIVDTAFVEAYGSVSSLIGGTINFINYPVLSELDRQIEQAQIVGIVPYLGPNNSQSERTPRIYRPLAQGATDRFRMIAGLVPEIEIQYGELETKFKLASGAVDRDVSIYDMELVSVTNSRVAALVNILASAFSGVAVGALVLAAVGLYGLVSRAVIARRGEMGVRRAIGSTNFRVIAIFMRQGLGYLAAGIVVGGSFAVLVVNALGSTPFGPSLFSVLYSVFLTVTALVGIMVVLASYIPAKKVVALEPGEALHYE
ncbi:MAG: ABC transporter permease, partial [Sphingomonadales bacterium]|nr:ABC transporter permease [Sphingomonadales bacterium]